MTDSLLKAGKKALTWSVVSTTVAWSLGASALLAPLSASAAIPGAGSLVKLTCPARADVNDPCRAVYYLATNGKRYVFPNQKAYNTWHKDFSGVVNLTFDELSSIGIGGNVVYRAGTRLVKITTDKNVYAVEPGGKLRKVPSEAVAAELYGSSWAQRVDDVPDAFFTNYSIQSDVVSGKFPAGSLVKTAASSDVWYVDSTTKRKVTADGLTANRFNNNFVITTAVDFSSLTAGTDLATSEVADTSQAGTAAATTPAVGGSGLTVATAADTAVAQAVVTDSDAGGSGNAPSGGQNHVGFLKMRFTASADGPVTVNEISVARGGISADADLAQLYLYDADNLMSPLVESGTITNGKAKFTGGTGGLFTVAAGTTKDITVRGNIALNVASGKTIIFSVAASDVKTAGTVAVSGSAQGNQFTVAAVANLGQAQFRNISPTADTQVDPQDGYELWRFSYTAGEQDQILKGLSLTQVGSVSSDDIQNFKLMDSTTQLGSTISVLANNRLNFDLGNGLEVKSGVTKQLSLKGDIKKGTNRTYRFAVQNRYDVLAWDKNYSVYVGPVFVTNGGTNSNAFSVVQPNDGAASPAAANATIRTGRLVISTASDSPSGNVPDGATNVLLAKFSFTAAGEDVKVNSLTVNCQMAVTTDDLTNTKMMLDGSQVGSTDSTANCDATEDIAMTFGSSFIVPAGSTKVLEIRSDLTASTIGANDTIKINIEAGSSNAEGRVSLTTLSTATASGRTVTVQANAVTVSRNPSVVDWSSTRPTAVLGGSNKLIGSFVITGGGEDADVTQIVINDDVTTDTLADAFQNLKLVDDAGVQFGTTQGTLTDTTNTDYTFTPTTALRITGGGTRVINVYADVRNPNGGTITNFQTARLMNVKSVTATGVQTGSAASDTTSVPQLQNVYLAVQGNLSITVDGATPKRSTEVMGSTGVEFSRIKLAADVNEDITVTRLILVDTLNSVTNNTPDGRTFGGAGAATGTLKNIKLVDVATGNQIGGTVVGLDSSTSFSTSTPAADFNNITNLVVPRDSSVTLKVVADITSFTLGGVSSSTHRLAVRTNYSGASTTAEPVTATGRDSGIAVSRSCLDIGTADQGTCPGPTTTQDNGDSDVNGNFHDVFRAKLTIALAPGSPSGSKSPTVGQTVAIFRVSNSANVGNYESTLEIMNVDIGSTLSPTCTSTAASTCSPIKLFKDDTSSSNNVWSTNADPASNIYPAASVIADADMANQTIAAGSFRDFFVTIDTNQSTGASGSSRSLTVSINTVSRVEWGDGSSTSITLVDSIPVNGQTLTYSF